MLPKLTRNSDFWLATWKNDAGKRRFKSLGRRDEVTKAQADAALEAIIREHALNPALQTMEKAPVLSIFLAHYFAQRTDLDEATLVLQRCTGERLTAFFVPSIRMDAITRLQASKFRSWLVATPYTRSKKKVAEARRLSDASVAKHMRFTKQIFQWAADRDLIPFNPFDRLKAGGSHAQEHWTYVPESDLAKVQAHCPSDSWRLAFALARLAGLRLNEVRRAEWGWIDWQARTLAIKPKLRHGKRERTTKQNFRTVPLVPALYEQLRTAFEQAPERSTLICPTLGSSPSHAADKILARAGLGWSKPMHTLRKSRESDWLAQYPLPDVAKWMGHDPTVALRFYHQTKTDSIEAVTGRPPKAQDARATDLLTDSPKT